jgi:predicted Zn-ribbon and HTH transcriptional regulator
MEANSIVEKIEAFTPEQAAMLIQILNEDQGVQVVEAAAKVEDLVADVKPKAEKVKCKCCGFAKKARRVNAEGICKVCYMALATSGGESVTVVGRQGKRGRNTVSVVIGGERVKVQRKVRLEA